MKDISLCHDVGLAEGVHGGQMLNVFNSERPNKGFYFLRGANKPVRS